jgi:hypothetical protein
MDRVKLQRAPVFLRPAREPLSRQQLSPGKKTRRAAETSLLPICHHRDPHSLFAASVLREAPKWQRPIGRQHDARRVVIVYHGLSGVNGASQWLVLGVVAALG